MNAPLKNDKNILFKTAPTLIAAWPGPGNVGMMALDYLRYKFEAQWLTQLDLSTFFSPASISIKNGRLINPAPPKGIFYFKKDPSLILFECDTHFAEKESIALVNYLVSMAAEWGVAKIVTLGAFPVPMNHAQPSEIRYAASEEGFKNELERSGFIPIAEGEIAGPVGLVPTIAAGRNLKAACLLGTMPVYAGPFSYPKASFEILKGLENLLQFKVDLSQLEEAIAKMDDMFSTLENRLREQLPFLVSPEMPDQPEPGTDDDYELVSDEGPHEEASLSQPAIETIERLFEEAARDTSKAADLKKELDRWGVFKDYEDRFLDLFKKRGEPDSL